MTHFGDHRGSSPGKARAAAHRVLHTTSPSRWGAGMVGFQSWIDGNLSEEKSLFLEIIDVGKINITVKCYMIWGHFQNFTLNGWKGSYMSPMLLGRWRWKQAILVARLCTSGFTIKIRIHLATICGIVKEFNAAMNHGEWVGNIAELPRPILMTMSNDDKWSWIKSDNNG